MKIKQYRGNYCSKTSYILLLLLLLLFNRYVDKHFNKKVVYCLDLSRTFGIHKGVLPLMSEVDLDSS